MFAQSFPQLANTVLLINNWETRTRFSTVEHVQQLDEDRLVFYRRRAQASSLIETWEEVIVDRASKTITTNNVVPNPDGSRQVISKDVISEQEDGRARLDSFLWDVEGSGSGKVESFKNLVVRMLKASTFEQWSQQ